MTPVFRTHDGKHKPQGDVTRNSLFNLINSNDLQRLPIPDRFTSSAEIGLDDPDAKVPDRLKPCPSFVVCWSQITPKFQVLGKIRMDLTACSTHWVEH
mmetsp:Transcript_15417/g.31241  ORF Transcript_15417/g.31241 Transcript_15417/m.31241 type:complete len:98 (+) Transcript_15417:412-705(+)